MIIDTKYNIGDKVWGVCCDWIHPNVTCVACHGEGGANIPGTGVFVKCQQCDGEGVTKGEVHRYYARQETISNINIQVSGQASRVCYEFYRHTYRMNFQAVAGSQDEAWGLAKDMAEKDEHGELMERLRP